MELKDITKEAISVPATTTLEGALDVMLNDHTNTLLVVDEHGKLIGEVSVSDFFEGIVPEYVDGDTAMATIADEAALAAALQDARDKPVSEFMSNDYDSVRPDSPIMEVAAIAIAHSRARMPVVDHDNRPIGMISRRGLKQILGQYLHQDD